MVSSTNHLSVVEQDHSNRRTRLDADFQRYFDKSCTDFKLKDFDACDIHIHLLEQHPYTDSMDSFDLLLLTLIYFDFAKEPHAEKQLNSLFDLNHDYLVTSLANRENLKRIFKNLFLLFYNKNCGNVTLDKDAFIENLPETSAAHFIVKSISSVFRLCDKKTRHSSNFINSRHATASHQQSSEAINKIGIVWAFVAWTIVTLMGFLGFFLIPLKKYKNVYIFTLQFLTAFLSIAVLLRRIGNVAVIPCPVQSLESKNNIGAHSPQKSNNCSTAAEAKNVVLVLLLADMWHHIFDGLAIGASFSASTDDSFHIGLSTSIAIILHELPHKVGDIILLVKSGYSEKKATLIVVGASVVSILGVAVGCVTSMRVSYIATWINLFTAGMFLYIALVLMMSQMINSISNPELPVAIIVIAHLTGILLGLSIMLGIAIYENAHHSH
ncbi:hypothetical protein HZS_4679 [Henneguya salminicola]|nr:hypothetical protein HZS_4679 [Henneguya salminicola]